VNAIRELRGRPKPGFARRKAMHVLISAAR
jgi:hypothetical protein